MYDHPAILLMQLLSCYTYCVSMVYILSSEATLHSAAWSKYDHPAILFVHAAHVCLAILHLDCLNTFVLSLETQWHSAAWSMYDHPAILPMQLLSCHIVFHGLYIEFPGNMALGHFAHVQLVCLAILRLHCLYIEFRDNIALGRLV